MTNTGKAMALELVLATGGAIVGALVGARLWPEEEDTPANSGPVAVPGSRDDEAP